VGVRVAPYRIPKAALCPNVFTSTQKRKGGFLE
jgi:hypothetical protein